MLPILDPCDGIWMFDATVFYNLESASFPVPIMQIGHRGRIAAEVSAEIQPSARGGYDPIPWGWQILQLTGVEQLAAFAGLLRRWSATGREHRGEAASIALAQCAGPDPPMIFVTDDGVAFRTCERENVTATCTPQLLVACARVGWVSADEAWSAYEAVLSAGHRLIVASQLSHGQFVQLCARNGP